MHSGDTSSGGTTKDFSQTVPDLIRRVRHQAPDIRREALEELCRVYWKPVYCHLRRGWAKSNEDAKDLTQAFLLWLVEGNALTRYTPDRSALRTYLKSLLKHFVQNHDEALKRLKRGGGAHVANLNVEAGGLEGILADPQGMDPESVFDRVWKVDLIQRAVALVSKQFQAQGKALQFRVFEEYRRKESGEKPTYAALAESYGLKESDITNYLFAVRVAIRTEIRAELAKITDGPEELEEEWNAFFQL
jgi:RNA polymerase sigma-70 factor (ECF subfamily)